MAIGVTGDGCRVYVEVGDEDCIQMENVQCHHTESNESDVTSWVWWENHLMESYTSKVMKAQQVPQGLKGRCL
jgi:hypothetical protein